MIEVVDERGVVALDVVHLAPHPGVALAEPQVVGRVGLGRLALRPVPAAAVLEVDDVDGVAGDDRPAVLEPEVVHAAQALLEHLRPHDRRADGEHDAAVERLDRAAEQPEIDRRPPGRSRRR